MKLENKLSTTPPEQFINDLSSMLDRSSVSISWSAKRLVHIDGYEGSVEIHELAKTFLNAHPLENGSPSLKYRMDCYNLWKRMKALYMESDAELQSMCAYKILVPLSEFFRYFGACDEAPMPRIEEWIEPERKYLFLFPVKQYKALWPGSQPDIKITLNTSEFTKEYWYATKEMVKAKLKEQA